MPVTTRLNHVHPTRDVAILEEPWTVDEVREAARRSLRPLTQKAVPGTESSRTAMSSAGSATTSSRPRSSSPTLSLRKLWPKPSCRTIRRPGPPSGHAWPMSSAKPTAC